MSASPQAVPGEIRPTTRCRQKSCNAPYSAHPNTFCPDNTGNQFLRHTTRINAASNSFIEAEVLVLTQLIDGVLKQSRDLHRVLQTEAGRSLMRKIHTMRLSIERRKQESGWHTKQK